MITKAVLPGFRPSLHSKKADSCVFPRPWVHGVKFLLVGLTCVRARWPPIQYKTAYLSTGQNKNKHSPTVLDECLRNLSLTFPSYQLLRALINSNVLSSTTYMLSSTLINSQTSSTTLMRSHQLPYALINSHLL